MKRFQIIPRHDAAADAGPLAPRVVGGGPIDAWRLSPPDYPLWMVEAHLAAGARLRWASPHGEEAIYVKEGELLLFDFGVDGDADVPPSGGAVGRPCPAGSALVLEARANPLLDVTRPSVIVWMATRDGVLPAGGPVGDPEQFGTRTHLVGPRGIAEWSRPPTKLTRYYTTSTCSGCRLMLMYSASEQQYGSAVHSHTADELIHVLKGAIRVGSRWAEPGDTLAVPANVRYRFETGDDGYGFINYRADASYYVSIDGTRLLEAGGGEQFVYTGDGADYVSAEAYAAQRQARAGS
jgi:hypothetical protein